MRPPHIDNLLDLVSTSGKQRMTQTTGLPQGDKSDGSLTEGRLGVGEEEERFIVYGQKIRLNREAQICLLGQVTNCKRPWACPPFPLPHTLGQQSGNN